MFHLLLCAALTGQLRAAEEPRLNSSLQKYAQARIAEFDQIPQERRQQLADVALYVRQRRAVSEPARLTFICTHNSRRSHLAQIWAHAAAAHFGVANVQAFSGGTEASAFNPRAIQALERTGFEISCAPSEAKANPRYQVCLQRSTPPLACFSKVYDQAPNPTRDFCAILVCSQADEACPLVPGASLRIAIPYDDPKAFDDTPQEAKMYDERCRQIAREMLSIFSQL